MRTFPCLVLGLVAVLNGLLGLASQSLGAQMAQRLQTYGAIPPAVTLYALRLPPAFWWAAGIAVLGLVLHLCRKVDDSAVLGVAFGLLFLDVGLLWSLHFGVTIVALRM